MLPRFEDGAVTEAVANDTVGAKSTSPPEVRLLLLMKLLRRVDGALPVTRPVLDPAAADRLAAAPDRVAHWERRLADVRQDRPA